MHARVAEILERARSLPAHTALVRMRNPRGILERRFTGALLWDYVRNAGILPEGAHEGAMSNYYFVARAEDGFRVALAFGEVAPHFADKEVLIAYEQDGEPVMGGVRLVVPGDDLGGRSVVGLADIELRSVPSTTETTGEKSTSLDIVGLIARPHRYYPSTLPRLTRRFVDLPARLAEGDQAAVGKHEGRTPFAGLLLYELLEAAGIILDPAINEDVLGKIIVARSVDGYAAVIAAGEIEPRFMNGPVLVALSRDSGPLLEDEGLFRLVVPYDRASGRSVKRLASLELRNA